MHNLRSFSLDTTTGQAFYGTQRVRNHPDQYLHVLVPAHEVARFEDLHVAHVSLDA